MWQNAAVYDSRIVAVVFDLYETLITEFDPGWRPRPTPAEILGVDQAVFEQVWDAHRAERMVRTVDYRDVLREACKSGGVTIDEQVIAALYAERLAGKAMPFRTIDPALLRTLRTLREAGLTIGVISNCSIEEVGGWATSELAPLFDVATFSCDFGSTKPDPEIYLHTCRRLGAGPQSVAFVGDGGSDELRGAAAIGMRPYCARWFLDRWPAQRRDRDRYTSSFPQLSEFSQLLTIFSPDRQCPHPFGGCAEDSSARRRRNPRMPGP